MSCDIMLLSYEKASRNQGNQAREAKTDPTCGESSIRERRGRPLLGGASQARLYLIMAYVANPDYLSLADIRGICVDLLTRLGEYHDPQPDPSPREPHILEAILEQPKQTFDGEDLYPIIEEKAACYFYFIIKNHAFRDGNKRFAFITTFVFLRRNGFNFTVSSDELFSFALRVAQRTENHDREYREVVAFVRAHVTPET